MGWGQHGDSPDRRRARWQRRAGWLRRLKWLSLLAGVGVAVTPIIFARSMGLGGATANFLLCVGCLRGADAFGRMAKRADVESKRPTPAEQAQEDARIDAAIAALERKQAAAAAEQDRLKHKLVAPTGMQAVRLENLKEADFPTTTLH